MCNPLHQWMIDGKYSKNIFPASLLGHVRQTQNESSTKFILHGKIEMEPLTIIGLITDFCRRCLFAQAHGERHGNEIGFISVNEREMSLASERPRNF